MKKISWKVLNFAVYYELLLSYFLPFKIVNKYEYQVGFPFPFLTVYDKAIIHINPYQSMLLNGWILLLNLVIIYFVTVLIIKLYKKIRNETTTTL